MTARIISNLKSTGYYWALPPLWFVEGFAEYLSTKSDDMAQLVLKDALFNGFILRFENH